MSKKANTSIPVFFGFDERFAPYAYVAVSSLVKNASPERTYEIHLLHTDLSEETIKTFKTLETENINIMADNIYDDIKDLISHLPIRDYYSVSTYFRIVIAEKFPQYDKAIYIDSDVVVNRDVSELFDINLKDHLVGAVSEAVMQQTETGLYAERVVGVDRKKYFNAGVLLMNTKLWREEHVLKQFIDLSSYYDFTIAQDQDYLNVICKDRVKYLKRIWNMECIHKWKIKDKKFGIIHYAFCAKPWNDNTAPYSEYFWKYAKGTPYFMQIKKGFSDITLNDLKKGELATARVFTNCVKEIEREDNYLKRTELDSMKDVFAPMAIDDMTSDDLKDKLGVIYETKAA